MKFGLFLALLAGVCYAQQVGSEYYVGFTETMGIDTPMTEDNLECIKGVSSILSDVKVTLEENYRDVDSLIEATIEFIDRLYFEIGSTCKVFVGEFETFMQDYSGGTDALRMDIEDNLDVHHSRVSREIHLGLIADKMEQEQDGGSLHANVFRMLLGLTVNDLTVNGAVLEEERRINEEMRSESDKGHFSVRAPKGVVDNSDVMSGKRTSDETGDSDDIGTYVDYNDLSMTPPPEEIDMDYYDTPDGARIRQLQEVPQEL